MEAILCKGAEWPGAVGVSGGADSLALLLLLADWAEERGLPAPVTLTVDHGLQPHSKKQADEVVMRAAEHGLTAHVLRWRGRKPVADIESAAREARYKLMGDWCLRHGIRCLFVAHSLDDQAETFLLRLMRGSGVDGLAAMAEVAPFPSPNCADLRVARPLLGLPRARLRAFLSGRGESWFDDEMNADPRFARARLRAGWPVLEKLGFSAGRIAAAAGHLARARAALDQDASDLLSRALRREGQCVFLDGGALSSAPEEVRNRCLARILMQVSGRIYRPRYERLERLADAIRLEHLKGGRTLHGCCIGPASKREACFGPRTVRIARERRANLRRNGVVAVKPGNSL
jgi:tRNA(Ile)-lysidine synthase